MRKRVYFLVPHVKRAQAVFKELLLSRVEERHIHVIAKEGTDLGDLPEATDLQKSDVLHGALLGLVAGALTGAVAGAVALLFPPSGSVLGLGVILATSIVGAVMGVWVSGMIGSSTPSTHLEAFADEIERGKVLLIVDLPRRRADELSHMIRKHHPEADMRDKYHPAPSGI
jgi:hypothetical protein